MGLTFLPGTRRDGFATVLPGKLWRFDGGAAVTRCAAGWPGTPGMFTEATIPNVRGFVDGIEVPIAVAPLRGKHPDGSYRSLAVQVRGVASFLTRAFRLEIWSTPRSGANTLTWIEPTWGVPVAEDATDWPAVSFNAVVASTDAVHLCNSYVALEPLQPQSQDSATSAAYFGVGKNSEFDRWVAFMDTLTPAPTVGTATYEHVHAFQEAYCRTGDLGMYERHHKWLLGQLGTGTTFRVGVDAQFAGGDNYAKLTAIDPTLPVPASSASGLVPEWHSGVRFGWATGYLLSSWKQPWRLSSYHLSWLASSATYSMSTEWMPRFNLRLFGLPILTSYFIEANMQVGNGAGGFGSGRDPNVITFGSQLPSILAALIANAYSGYGSGFADGVVGMMQTADETETITPGQFPLFQMLFVSNILTRYYQSVSPDPWIPVVMKRTADFIIAQGTPSGNFASWPWLMTDDLGSPPPAPGNTDPWFAPFYVELFGFAYAMETDPTDKATYLEWLDRAINPAALTAFTKTGKAFGEYLGANHSGAYYRDGGVVRGIAGAHPTVITEPPIWTS